MVWNEVGSARFIHWANELTGALRISRTAADRALRNREGGNPGGDRVDIDTWSRDTRCARAVSRGSPVETKRADVAFLCPWVRVKIYFRGPYFETTCSETETPAYVF